MNTLNHSPYYPECFVLRASTGQNISAIAKKLGVKASLLKKWESGAEPAPTEIIDRLKLMASRKDDYCQSKFTFIDLFAGIGGLRKAFESIGGQCIFTSEWNKTALETYAANFSVSHPIAGDITTIEAALVPDHDVLVGGFPCQPFSLAGVSQKNAAGKPHGFADETQGTLFFDVARIIAAKRPKAFLLENVRNLASHDKGKTFDIIKRTLIDELGYTVSWKIMEGTSWVPQRRPRIAIVGFRDGHQFDFDTVVTPTVTTSLRDVLHQPGEANEIDNIYTHNGVPHDKYTLSDGLWCFLQKHAAKHAKKGNGFGYCMHGPEDIARTLTARYGKDGAEILISQDEENPRRLTPRECARLMGFDRHGFEPIKIPVSDTQAYKQFGNSVIVPMFSAIASAMEPHIATTIQDQVKSAA